MVQANVEIGQVWQNPQTRRRFLVLAVEPEQVVVERLDCLFPDEPVCSLPPPLFRTLLRPEEEVLAQDIERYLARMADRD
jgi:hypothetical protein